MRLTPELVALCHRDVPEPEPNLRYDYFTDADYESAKRHLLSRRPEGPFWLFAYGSLMWKPEFDTVEQRRAVAHGWQRGFSLAITSHRGTPEQPGYMMCLDRGGACEGLILRLDDALVEDQLMKLLYRELGSHESLDGVRWIETETVDGPVTALTFYAAPTLLDIYDADRPVTDVARALARACGHWGSGAAYLRNTVAHLEELGVHDPRLWQLQELVAAEVESLYGLSVAR